MCRVCGADKIGEDCSSGISKEISYDVCQDDTCCSELHIQFAPYADEQHHCHCQDGKEKLVFYYIVIKEGILPTDEEYKKLYDELFDEYVVYYMEGKTEADYSDAEKYKTERAAAEKAVIEFYGDAFFRDQVYYDFAIEKLLDFSEMEIIE